LITAPNKEIKTNWLNEINLAKETLERNKAFGVPLKTLMTSEAEEGNEIPSFLRTTIQVISQQFMQVEGLFRLSGNRKDVENLKKMVDTGAEVEFTVSDRKMHGKMT